MIPGPHGPILFIYQMPNELKVSVDVFYVTSAQLHLQ